MKLERISLKNFRLFRDVKISQIPRFCVFVGANGTGKSTLFSVFTFLKDALAENVHTALTRLGGNRGFQEVRSRNSAGPIEIEIQFRQQDDSPLITYLLAINEEQPGQPFVEREILKYRRGSKGQPWHFLDFKRGEGEAVTNEPDQVADEHGLNREKQSLKSPEILAVKGLAQFKQFPAALALGELISNWHISDFQVHRARSEPEAGLAEHLSKEGENLALVTEFLYTRHRKSFDLIIDKLRRRVPGIAHVDAKITEEGRVLLRFQDGAFKDPFLSRYVSDGTIKMFAYLVLLHDPSPHPLLCVEEPENYLYPRLLWELAEEFRDYARRGGQVLASTHSADFLNAARLDEVYWLQKKDGYSTVQRAADDPQLQAFMDEGDQMGHLWTQGFFPGAHPQ